MLGETRTAAREIAARERISILGGDLLDVVRNAVQVDADTGLGQTPVIAVDASPNSFQSPAQARVGHPREEVRADKSPEISAEGGHIQCFQCFRRLRQLFL